MSKNPVESRVPLLKRSGLPRLASTRQKLSNLSSCPLPIASVRSFHTPFSTKPRRISASKELYEEFDEEAEDISRYFRSDKHNKSDRYAWKRFATDEPRFATDESSPFSRQLAKIAKGSDSDLYLSCQEQSYLPRPAWPGEGSFSESSTELLSKEYVGRRVIVGDKEQGTLRYFGRTAFASGLWCGVELDRPRGKNDGSVDGVIYFTCSYDHGIFAPSDKVNVISTVHHSDMRPKRSRCDKSLNETSCRLSTISSGSSSSGASALSSESQKKLSSGASSSATFTIATREEMFSDYCSSPTYHKSSSSSQQDAEGSDVISPADGTFEDSSLGILSPDQMPDFSGPNSLEKSASDENIAGIEYDTCAEGAVGGIDIKWKSRENISEFTEELIQEDISAIIHELHSNEVDSDSPPKSLGYTSNSKHSISSRERTTSTIRDISVRPKFNVKINHVNNVCEDVQTRDNKPTERRSPDSEFSFPVNVEVSPKRQLKTEKDSNDWSSASQLNMTLSAASLDQGYQGDGEFDVPSEAGSIAASSPTENHSIFERIEDIHQVSTYSNLSQCDTSIAEDETESESVMVLKDRRIRIIDGKFYHGHKEITSLRQFDMRGHDPLSSEMDSSGFYSDLDHRDEDSTRMEISSLKPLEEGKTDVEMSDSAIEDIIQFEEKYIDSNFESKEPTTSNDLKSKHLRPTEELTVLDQIDNIKNDEYLRQNEIPLSQNGQLNSIAHAHETITENYNDRMVIDIDTSTGVEGHTSDGVNHEDQLHFVETLVPRTILTENHETGVFDEQIPEQEKQQPRTYEKPWLKRSYPTKPSEKSKPVLPPPPPMPKKNVQSKLKLMLESQEPSNEERRQRQPKKGRWDDVMNKIEEGKKEDSLKPRVKVVKSRIMETLKTQQVPSPQVEKMRQERKERREKRERQVAVRMFNDRKRSSASNRTSRAPSLESVNAGSNPRFESENSTPDILQGSSHNKDPDTSNIRIQKVETSRNILSKKPSRKISDPIKVGRPNIVSNRVTNNNTYNFTDELKRKDVELYDKKAEIARYREETRQQQKGIEALSILVNYLTTEYDSFTTPHLKLQIEKLCSKLDQLKLNLDDSSTTIQKLQHESQKAMEAHDERMQILQEKHIRELNQLRDHHTNEIATINSENSKKLYEVLEEERSQRKFLEETHFMDLEKAKTQLHLCLETTKKEHSDSIELLKNSLANELTEWEARWVSREKEHKEVKTKLERDKEALREQSKMLEKTLLSDKDHKLQAAKGVCTALENEVDSLKSVLEMRNTEIHQLREQVVDRERLCDDLQTSRERIRSLRAKTEDLTAQMEKKSQLERQRYLEYRQMSDSVQRESCVNRRLTQDNEELQWKIRNRELNLSSMSNDSPQDFESRTVHHSILNGSHNPGQPFTSTPKRMNGAGANTHNGRCIPSRDASFNKYNIESSPPNSTKVKAVIEKSNSIAFILEMNERCLKDEQHSRSGQEMNVPKHVNVLSKSMSASHVNGGRKNSPSCYRKANVGNRGNFLLKLASCNENLRDRRTRKSCSTSESSDGCEIERISPTGNISWTVPAETNKKSRTKEDAPSLLSHPDEDEYEESELVDVLELESDTIIEDSLSNILEGRGSATPSDSDASQCGSRVEMSSDSDSSDDGTELAALTDRWVLQEGAGEAMVAPDALSSRNSEVTDKDSDRPQSNVTSLFSSDSEDVLPKGSLNMSWSEDCDLTSSSEMQDL